MERSLSDKPPEPSGHPGGGVEQRTHWPGYVHVLVRVAAAVVALLYLGLFVAAIPFHAVYVHTVCASILCEGIQTKQEIVVQLQRVGLSFVSFANYSLVLQVVFVAVFSVVALIIFCIRSRDWMALVVAVFLVTFAVNVTDAPRILEQQYHAWWLPIACLAALGEIFFPLCFYLFPNGRFAPRWTRWLLIGWFVWGVVTYFFPTGSFHESVWYLTLEVLLAVLAISTLLMSQVYRFYYVSDATQCQQTKWAVFGFTIGLGGFFLAGVVGFLLPVIILVVFHQQVSTTLFGIIALTISYVVPLIIPLTIGTALLRFHLWDVDALIKRTLVYSLLTLALVVVYALCILMLQLSLQGLMGTSDAAVIVSTLAIAALFQPLRGYLQQVIDRRFYRRKYDARRAIAEFNRTLQGEIDLEQLSERLAMLVEEAMQPRFFSLWLRRIKRPEENDALYTTLVAKKTRRLLLDAQRVTSRLRE